VKEETQFPFTPKIAWPSNTLTAEVESESFSAISFRTLTMELLWASKTTFLLFVLYNIPYVFLDKSIGPKRFSCSLSKADLVNKLSIAWSESVSALRIFCALAMLSCCG
jgi:hypothetical protein